MEIIEIHMSVTNCYLIKYAGKYILVDTGYEHEWGRFSQELSNAGARLNEIIHIVLTHHDDDHCGLLNKIKNENPSVKVVMSHLAKDLLLTGHNDRTHGGGFVNKRVLFLKRIKNALDKNWSGLKFLPYQVRENDILIKGDTRLEDIGIPLKGVILETPGHSIDSISLIFDDGDCLVGDAAANILQFAGTKYCVIRICDIKEYYKSWAKILSVNAKRIYPAHGKPFLAEKLKQNIGKNKKIVPVN